MRYLKYSQRVRREIESIPELLDNVKRAFAGQAEPFTSGGSVNLYRLGRTPSGLWTALRAYRKDISEGRKDREQQARLMEYYCQNAEELDGEGESVPVFCIGAVCGNSAGIITEDLTANAQYQVEHHPDDDHGFVIHGNQRRKVFIDIDGVFRRKFGFGIETKYFSPKNVLVL